MSRSVALYSAVDDMLTRYAVDVDAATLTRMETIRTPAKVQYAWPHPTRQYLYVSTSNGGPRVVSDYNHVSAFAVEPGTGGVLRPLGEPKPLSRRAVHMCVDPSGRFVLNGHNFPTSGITVHRVGSDGSVGEELDQRGGIDYGIYPHQVIVLPGAPTALIVDRGNHPASGKAEDPGALRTFGFDDGVLTPGHVVAPSGGYGFGPRHVAFHPTQPWMYVSDERTNRLYMFRVAHNEIEAQPAFTLDTLADPSHVAPRQLGGPIHVHANGLWVYVVNRADHTTEVAGQKVFAGGENTIAVYAIDPDTGAPSLLHHADTHSFHVRTFACDPSGTLLVTASIKAMTVRHGDKAVFEHAALSVFRITEHGTLEFVRKYDVETQGAQLQYWMGMFSVS